MGKILRFVLRSNPNLSPHQRRTHTEKILQKMSGNDKLK